MQLRRNRLTTEDDRLLTRLNPACNNASIDVEWSSFNFDLQQSSNEITQQSNINHEHKPNWCISHIAAISVPVHIQTLHTVRDSELVTISGVECPGAPPQPPAPSRYIFLLFRLFRDDGILEFRQLCMVSRYIFCDYLILGRVTQRSAAFAIVVSVCPPVRLSATLAIHA